MAIVKPMMYIGGRRIYIWGELVGLPNSIWSISLPITAATTAASAFLSASFRSAPITAGGGTEEFNSPHGGGGINLDCNLESHGIAIRNPIRTSQGGGIGLQSGMESYGHGHQDSKPHRGGASHCNPEWNHMDMDMETPYLTGGGISG